jgi:hypothetical protein
VAKSKADRYGIGMKKFCRAHEEKLARALAEEGPSRELLALHLEKLRWLQHERLVHLIVLVMTVLAELFALDLALLHPETDPAAAAAVLGLAVLLAFYFAHYFFLENTTQHWYRLAEELGEALKARGGEGDPGGKAP